MIKYGSEILTYYFCIVKIYLGCKMKNRFISALLLAVTFCLGEMHSQDISKLVYTEDTTFSSEGVRELRFRFRNLNFFRDNEYKGSLVKGYTLPGLWVLPTVSYQPLKTLKIEAGAYMLRYWGESKYPNTYYANLPGYESGDTQSAFHAVPFFRVHYAPLPGVSLVLGNIYGRNNHGLIAPLYNKEMVMTSDPEAGVQFLWNTRHFNLDMWVNWESFIFQGDNQQEEFTFGVSSRIKANSPSLKDNSVHFYVPLQLLFKHQGGEINTTATERGVKTWLNAAAGFGLDIKMPFRNFTKLNIEADAAYYAQQKGSVFPFDNGYGFYGKAVADLKSFRLHAGYWQCHNFVSLMGDPLFGAVSMSNRNLVYNNPKTAFLSLEYSHQIGKGFALGVHADVYNTFAADTECTSTGEDGNPVTVYSSVPNSISFLAGIYLRTDFSFLIKRF